MTPQVLEKGYWRAYQDFYRWGSIFQSAWSKPDWVGRARHLAYSGGWKKFEPFWDLVIRLKQVTNFLPVLESILDATGQPVADETSRGRKLVQNNGGGIAFPVDLE
jgi:hypothetical protein